MESKVLVPERVARELSSFPRSDLKTIVATLDSLGRDQRPSGARPVEGKEGLFAIRAGQYRIAYMIRSDQSQVLVIRVSRR